MNAFDPLAAARAALTASAPNLIECNACGDFVEREDSVEIEEEIWCGVYGLVRVCEACS